MSVNINKMNRKKSEKGKKKLEIDFTTFLLMDKYLTV